MYQLQLASNKELDLFMYASGGRKIMENIFKAPSVLGINEILSDILKKNVSRTNTLAYTTTSHAGASVS